MNEYLKVCSESEAQVFDRWKMLEYNSGHLTEHVDMPADTETHHQVAIQILLPPKEICNYKGGILKVRVEKEIVDLYPCDEKWTHVIIPIGLPHEITPVEGTRISYIRQVFIKKDPSKEYPKQLDMPGIQLMYALK